MKVIKGILWLLLGIAIMPLAWYLIVMVFLPRVDIASEGVKKIVIIACFMLAFMVPIIIGAIKWKKNKCLSVGLFISPLLLILASEIIRYMVKSNPDHFKCDSKAEDSLKLKIEYLPPL